MKIFEVVPSLVSGGGERLVVELSNELALQGHDVTIVTLYDKLNSHILESHVNRNLIKRISLNKKRGFDVNCIFRLFAYIKKEKPDVVHTHTSATTYILFPSIFLQGCRFFATIHSEAKREAGKFLEKLSRQIMFRYNLCTPVTISKKMELSFERFYKRTAPIVNNGITPYRRQKQVNLHENDSQIVFIHVGSCRAVKNQSLLFEAFTRIVQRHQNVKLYWIGRNDDDLFASLSSYFSDKITYMGEVNNVRDYMHDADALCLSSVMEGSPITIIEAFSVGCIPLCTPVGGCVDMIQDGVNGFLSADMTVEAYSDMLEKFMDMSSDERKVMRQNSIKSFSTYDIANTAKRYIEIFKKYDSN